jgi:hypothetical protein
VDLRAGLDDLERRKFLTLPVLELRSLGRPARSQSLPRLPETIRRYYILQDTSGILKIPTKRKRHGYLETIGDLQ